MCTTRALTLQVIPYGAGGHAAPSGFSILRFAERDLPDVVYVENLTSALYLDKQIEVDRYMLAMERMSLTAYVPQRDSRRSSTRSSGNWRRHSMSSASRAGRRPGTDPLGEE